MEPRTEMKRKYTDFSWQELRDAYSRDSYDQFFKIFMDEFAKHPESSIAIPEDRPTQLQIEYQQQKAVPLALLESLGVDAHTFWISKDKRDVYDFQDASGGECRAWREGNKKLWVNGANQPKEVPFQNVTARFYLTLDPRRATDALFGLVNQLKNQGILNAINICLFTLDAVDYHILNNAIVVYVND